MTYPYSGDRQLDPDEEWECPWCGHLSLSLRAHRLHMSRCQKNENVDLPDEDPGDME